MNLSPLSTEFVVFAAECEQAASLVDLEAMWMRRIRELGFSFAALGAHVDPLRPDRASYLFQNYPAKWIEHYSEWRYHLIDPVFRAAESGAAEFQWTDPEFLRWLSWRQRRILAEAQEFGLRHGRTHTLASILRLRASASLVSGDPDVSDRTYAAAKLTNILVHHRAAQMCAAAPPRFAELRRRERQCLELCVSGLTDLEVAHHLGIGIATVRRHIEAARVRLGASTRIQAAARAIFSGQIKPDI